MILTPKNGTLNQFAQVWQKHKHLKCFIYFIPFFWFGKLNIKAWSKYESIESNSRRGTPKFFLYSGADKNLKFINLTLVSLKFYVHISREGKLESKFFNSKIWRRINKNMHPKKDCKGRHLFGGGILAKIVANISKQVTKFSKFFCWI